MAIEAKRCLPCCGALRMCVCCRAVKHCMRIPIWDFFDVWLPDAQKLVLNLQVLFALTKRLRVSCSPNPRLEW
eukprot:304871-Amphidinium_carterae.1